MAQALGRKIAKASYLVNPYIDSSNRLSAIMLGRFRMTVPDCLCEYERLGDRVLGKPRYFTRHVLAGRNTIQLNWKIYLEISQKGGANSSLMLARYSFDLDRGSVER